MMYRVSFADGSEELLEADDIADARDEAKELYSGKIKKIVAQDPVDCEDDDEDEDLDEDDEDEDQEDDDEE